MSRHVLAVLLLVVVLVPAPALGQTPAEPEPAVDRPPFGSWLESVRAEALSRGISEKTVALALDAAPANDVRCSDGSWIRRTSRT